MVWCGFSRLGILRQRLCLPPGQSVETRELLKGLFCHDPCALATALFCCNISAGRCSRAAAFRFEQSKDTHRTAYWWDNTVYGSRSSGSCHQMAALPKGFQGIRRASFLRFCVVALSESLSLMAGVATAAWLDLRPLALGTYAVLAAFSNLFLFSSLDRDRGSAISLPKRSSYAFAAALIYLGYVFLLLLAFFAVAPNVPN